MVVVVVVVVSVVVGRRIKKDHDIIANDSNYRVVQDSQTGFVRNKLDPTEIRFSPKPGKS